LAVAQPRDRIVFVESLQRFGGRFNVPLDQRRGERFGDLDRQHGFAGAGLALDEERTLQRDRGINRDLEIVGGDVTAGTLETHKIPSAPDARIRTCRYWRSQGVLVRGSHGDRQSANRLGQVGKFCPQTGISVPEWKRRPTISH
jgi:hypothetical protein